MRVHYMVGTLLTAALITGCQTSTAADEAAIRAIGEAFDAAYNSRDATALAAIFTDDAVRMIPNEEADQGREAIRAAFVAEFESGIFGADSQGEVRDVHILGDLAAARGTWSITATPTDGEPFQDRGYWTAVYRRQDDGSWKVVWNIGASALPARPAPVTEDVAADAEAVGGIIADYQQALNSGDLDACMAMYAADAVFMPNEGPPQIGLAAIRTYYRETTLLTRFGLTFSPTDVQVSGDLTWATVAIAGRLTPPTGEAYSLDGKAVFLFRRSPSGDWEVIRYIFNANAPLPTGGR